MRSGATGPATADGTPGEIAWLAPYAGQIAQYTGDDFRYLPIFLAGFLSIFFGSRLLLWSGLSKLDSSFKWKFASTTASFCHGSTTFTLCMFQLLANPGFLGLMDGRNQPGQELIMQISTAYMLSDSIFLVVWDPDFLFIGHHAITITYMVWCIWLGQGALSCLLLMAVGEVTSPFQNIWLVSRDCRHAYAMGRRVFLAMTPFYTSFFIVIRTFVGPYFVYYLIVGLLGSKSLGDGPKYVWSTLAFAGTAGSVGWSLAMGRYFSRWTKGTLMTKHKKSE